MTTKTVSIPDLKALMVDAFVASEVDPEIAASVAEALTLAEIDGRKGHGLSRVPSYAAQARSGKVNGTVEPVAERVRPGSLLVNVCYGFAYPAFDLAMEMLPNMAQECGIALAGFTNSHHFGVAAQPVERLADEGLIAFVCGNTPAAMAPWGGKRAILGTNPLAFAAPQSDGPPLVIDMALTTTARANLIKAEKTGEPIPEGWALDAEGRPTTDAKTALDGGTMTPLGGAKGAALALMVEVLSACLTNANYGMEASSFFSPDGPPPGVGQLLIAIDPGAFGDPERVLLRTELLLNAIDAQEGARIPGSRRHGLREEAEKDGITVDAALWAEVEAISAGTA